MQGSFGKKTISLFLFLLFISFLLQFLDTNKKINFVRKFAWPILFTERQIYQANSAIKQQFAYLGSLKVRESEIQRLQTEIRRLSQDQNQLTACLSEKEKMQKLLGAPLPTDWNFIPVKIAGVNDHLIIFAGSRQGIKKGAVLVSENIVVGRIVDVFDNASVVLPVTSPASKIPVVIKRSSTGDLVGRFFQGKGLLVGESDDSLILDKILQEEDVQKGDLVVTSGEDDWLPELLIGRVEEVLPKTAEVFRRARVSPLYNSHGLDTVFVVVP